MLRRLAWVVCAGALAWSCATAEKPLTCDPGKTICSNACVEIPSDPDNCGACGTVCPTAQVCVAGTCVLECPAGNAACVPDGGARGFCVDVKNDNANCGKCGTTCKAGQACVGGQCASSCSTAQTLCAPDGGGASFCANLKTDNTNCGACGAPCPSGELCSNGLCVGSCTTSQTACDAGYCAQLDTDNANCGSCGKTCGLLEACSAGVCVSECLSTQTLCKPDGGTPFCADTSSDNTNCGTCGNKCPSNKPVCSGGTCSNGSCNKNALLLGDGIAASNTAYSTLLGNVGFTVTSQASGTTTYAGSPAATGFGVIIVTPGSSYGTDMPSAGQTAIVNALAGGTGTGVIFTEWAAYEVSISQYATLSSLLCFSRSSGVTSTLTFTLTASGHPIWNGLASSFTTSVSLGGNISGTLASGATQIASCTQCGTYGVAVRDPIGTGRVVQIAHAASYASASWYSDSNLTTMMANSALWAARCD